MKAEIGQFAVFELLEGGEMQARCTSPKDTVQECNLIVARWKASISLSCLDVRVYERVEEGWEEWTGTDSIIIPRKDQA